MPYRQDTDKAATARALLVMATERRRQREAREREEMVFQALALRYGVSLPPTETPRP